MDRLQKRPGGPHVTVALHSSQRGTEVRIRLQVFAGRLSCRTVARLLAVVVLALAATAAAVPAHEEALARGVLYSIAGFAIGARPRTAHDRAGPTIARP